MAKQTKRDALASYLTRRYAFETYWRPKPYDIDRMINGAPHVWNGEVSVRRWRVIVEPVEESVEVLYARLLDLWERSHNMHEYGPLQAAAREIGRELPSDRLGKRRGDSPADEHQIDYREEAKP
jgi:hypothetical protein